MMREIVISLLLNDELLKSLQFIVCCRENFAKKKKNSRMNICYFFCFLFFSFNVFQCLKILQIFLKFDVFSQIERAPTKKKVITIIDDTSEFKALNAFCTNCAPLFRNSRKISKIQLHIFFKLQLGKKPTARYPLECTKNERQRAETNTFSTTSPFFSWYIRKRFSAKLPPFREKTVFEIPVTIER